MIIDYKYITWIVKKIGHFIWIFEKLGIANVYEAAAKLEAEDIRAMLTCVNFLLSVPQPRFLEPFSQIRQCLLSFSNRNPE